MEKFLAAGVEASDAGALTTRMSLWWSWARIAAEHVGLAREARAKAFASTYEWEGPDPSLGKEFSFAIQAIAASAFSTEALALELEAEGHAFTAPKPGRKVTAGYHIGHRLVHAFATAVPLAGTLPDALDRLFDLRNGAVHFTAEDRDGLYPHPSGTKTALEISVYTLEEAEVSVRLIHTIVSEAAQSASDGRLCAEASRIGGGADGILRMLEDVMRTAGIAT